MSGSRQQSKSRLPAAGIDPLDDLHHGHARIREVASALRDVTPYSQAPVPRPTATPSIGTISSDPSTYEYPPSVSRPTSSDYTATLVSSPTNLDSLVARGNEPWPDSGLINTMGWENSESWPEYGDLPFSQDQFTGWQQPQQAGGWHVERSMTAPAGTNVSSPALSPVTRQSLVGYSSLRQHTRNLTNLDPSSEVPYPIVYPDPQPSGSSSGAAPSSHFRESTEPPPLPSHAVDSEQDDFAGKQSPFVLPSNVEKAVVDANQRRKEKARQVRSRSAVPSGMSRTKITKVSKGRQRALSPNTKHKAEEMRYYGACWRCRKYKKPCTGPGVCDTCVTSGFRVWPSALGCRRGDLDNFAFSILPTNAEQILSDLKFDYPKPNSWRKAPQLYRSEKTIPTDAAQGDKWDQLLLKVQSTRMHGLGILELLEIAIRYQRSREKENKVIANAARCLSSTCDFYRLIVATDDPLVMTSPAEISSLLTQNRKLLIAALSTFLNSCLTGRLRDWFPTFVAACMLILAYVVLADAIIAIPPQFRDKVWYNIQAVVIELRQHLYPTAQDLLSALGKGSKLLNMKCWGFVEVQGETPSSAQQGAKAAPKQERNTEGMRMMDEDAGTFDGLRALQLWHEKYGPLMKDDVWFANAPYTVDVLPIASMERMFDFSPRA